MIAISTASALLINILNITFIIFHKTFAITLFLSISADSIVRFRCPGNRLDNHCRSQSYKQDRHKEVFMAQDVADSADEGGDSRDDPETLYIQSEKMTGGAEPPTE